MYTGLTVFENPFENMRIEVSSSSVIVVKNDHFSHIFLLLGECVIVDNHRVLHGRRSYSLKPGGSRLLEGGYIDWDELRFTFNEIFCLVNLQYTMSCSLK